jgi:thioredoxin-related protein
MVNKILLISVLLKFGFINQIEVSEKYSLIIFEGSDWCPGCIRLEKNILNDSAFIQYLNHNDIELVKIDFPQQKKISKAQKLHNQQIAEKYNFEGVFPTIIISRSDTLFYDKIFYRNESIEEIESVIGHKLQMLQ